jgi:hypothetical protein
MSVLIFDLAVPTGMSLFRALTAVISACIYQSTHGQARYVAELSDYPHCCYFLDVRPVHQIKMMS